MRRSVRRQGARIAQFGVRLPHPCKIWAVFCSGHLGGVVFEICTAPTDSSVTECISSRPVTTRQRRAGSDRANATSSPLRPVQAAVTRLEGGMPMSERRRSCRWRDLRGATDAAWSSGAPLCSHWGRVLVVRVKNSSTPECPRIPFVIIGGLGTLRGILLFSNYLGLNCSSFTLLPVILPYRVPLFTERETVLRSKHSFSYTLFFGVILGVALVWWDLNQRNP